MWFIFGINTSLCIQRYFQNVSFLLALMFCAFVIYDFPVLIFVWSCPQSQYTLPSLRHRATGAVLSPSKWWLAGGTSGSSYLDTSLIFSNGAFTSGPTLREGVSQHCAVASEKNTDIRFWPIEMNWFSFKVNETHGFVAGGKLSYSSLTDHAFIVKVTPGATRTDVPNMNFSRQNTFCLFLI